MALIATLIMLVAFSPMIAVLASVAERRQSVPPSLPGPWTSIGCYTDTATARTLSGATYTSTTSMTVEACIAFCTTSNYIYAGVEFGKQCFCDYALQNPGTPASLNDCHTPCTGNSAESCGAPNRMNIFFSGQPGPSIPQESFNLGSDFWTYQGCYTDDVNDRTLSHLGSSTVDGFSPTSEEVNCAILCDGLGYYYAGLEFGTQCWCGNDIGGTGIKAPETDCHMACKSASDEFCGGRNRLTLFHKDVCVASDVPDFWMIAFFNTPPASGPFGYYLSVNEVDAGYSVLGLGSCLACCGTGRRFDIQSRVLIAEGLDNIGNPFELLVGLPLKIGESPAFLNNQPPTSDYQIYCPTRASPQSNEVLAVNGRSDRWSLCPNTTANGRRDIVYDAIANHPHYVLSTCEGVFIQSFGPAFKFLTATSAPWALMIGPGCHYTTLMNGLPGRTRFDSPEPVSACSRKGEIISEMASSTRRLRVL